MTGLALAIYVLRPDRNALRTVLGTHPVRVFTFHRVTDTCLDPITVSPQLFRYQLSYLMRYHEVMPLDEAVASLVRKDRRRRPVAAITFDDGYESVFATAFPIMKELGVPGCAFVPTDFVGTQRRLPHDQASPAVAELGIMDWQQIQALRSDGWEIESHTASHTRLVDCGVESLWHELKAPLEILRRRLALEKVFLAYPFGGEADTSASSLEAALEVGYSACFFNFGGENAGTVDRARLHRIDIGANIPALAWKARIHGMPPLWMRRLLVWLRDREERATE